MSHRSDIWQWQKVLLLLEHDIRFNYMVKEVTFRNDVFVTLDMIYKERSTQIFKGDNKQIYKEMKKGREDL